MLRFVMDTHATTAPAKLNLTLHVGPRRADGFHEIESLIVRVGLCDTVTVHPRDDRNLSLSCDAAGIPTDERNLALRAARLLAGETSAPPVGVHITLSKRIPAGAGLGGGSSDAAATLRLLCRFWQLDLPPARLGEIAAMLGSDVPLFLRNGACVVRGRGEIVEPVAAPPAGWALLITPPIHADTAAVYRAWDELGEHPPRPPAADIPARARDAEHLMTLLYNDLESAAMRAVPTLGDFATALARVCAGARMTGSGAAFYRLFDRRIEAEAAGRHVGEALAVATHVVPILHA